MLPFAQVLLTHGICPIKHMSSVPQSEAHNIQTHDLSLGMLVSKYRHFKWGIPVLNNAHPPFRKKHTT